MKTDSYVTKLNKAAERIPDRVNGKHCGRQCRAMTLSICMKRNSEFTKLPKATERILDWANGNPCQRQCRTMACEHIWGLWIGIMPTAQFSIGNTQSSQRQTLSETVSGDDEWVHSWNVHRKLPSCLKLQREYSIDPTANPVRHSVRWWQVSKSSQFQQIVKNCVILAMFVYFMKNMNNTRSSLYCLDCCYGRWIC